MSSLPPDDIVATREFELRGADGTEEEVVLLLAKPHPDPRSEGDWRCPYLIRGGGEERHSVAYGIDGIQALQLALVKAAADLRHLAQMRGRTLTWLGDDDLSLT